MTGYLLAMGGGVTVESASRVSSRRAAAWVLAVGLGLLFLVVLGPLVGWWEPDDSLLEILSLLGTNLFFLILGVFIIRRADGNRVGWLFALMSIGMSLAALSGLLDGAGSFGNDGQVVSAMLGGFFWFSWIFALGFLMLWFPTGTVAGPRWRWLQGGGSALVGLLLLNYVFAEELCTFPGVRTCLVWSTNPVGLHGLPDPEYGSGLLVGLGVAFFLASLASLVFRFRQSGVVERLQLKWFLLACSVFVASVVIESVLEGVGGQAPG